MIPNSVVKQDESKTFINARIREQLSSTSLDVNKIRSVLAKFLESRKDMDYGGDFEKLVNDYCNDTTREIQDLRDSLATSAKKMQDYNSAFTANTSEMQVLKEALQKKIRQGQ